MPTPLTRPTNYPLPFAYSGTKNTIPTPPTGTGKASFTEGFPAVTMQPISAGGIPPEGKDFNGVLFDIMSHTVWVNAGGQYQFDAALSTAMGGYPIGMVLQNTAGTASYVSAIDNNTTDFNSTPSAIGTLWLPYSGSAFSNVSVATTGGTTVLTAIQAAAKIITVTGVLVSNATITFPVAIGERIVINNTTGSYSVTAIALAGSGVPITQGSADKVFSDGTNMRYVLADGVTGTLNDTGKGLATNEFVARAVSQVGGYYQDTGSVTNAYIVALIPPITSYYTGLSFRYRTTRACTGATTLNAGGGVKPQLREDGQPTEAGDIPVGSIMTITYDAAVSGGSFLISELVPSQLGECAVENIGQGLQDDGSGNLQVKLADTSMRRSSAGVGTIRTIASVATAHAIVAADNQHILISIAAVTYTAPLSSTLYNGFGLTVYATVGASTFTPNAADSVNGNPAGQSFSIIQGQSVDFETDGAGNWWPTARSSPVGAYAPAYVAAALTVAPGTYLVNTTAGAISITLPAGPSLGDYCGFKDAAGTFGTNNLTLLRNGTNIEGYASDLTCNVSGMDFEVWKNSSEWRLR